MGCNFVTLEPGKIVTAAGAEKTVKELEKRGVDVIEIDLDQCISLFGGSTHCVTAQLIREPGPLIEELQSASRAQELRSKGIMR